MSGCRWIRVPVLVVMVCAAAACGVTSSPTGGQGQAGSVASAGVPAGTVVAFGGSEIPQGWALCDGRTTATGRITPDLRNRFIMGHDASLGPIGEVGGAMDHTHTAAVSESRGDKTDVEDGDDHDVADDDHYHVVTVGRSTHLPPYVKLVYIMKE